MRTNSRSRGRGLVLAVLTLVVSLPELAWAQQTGLFPRHPIKRQRVPCDQEDPIYKVYKYQYFGYHPTCWRPFPNGWGCPSPEAPDKAKSFKELPLAAGEKRDALDEPEGGDEGGMPNQAPVQRPALPPLQGGARSPFEDPFETEKPATPPGGAPRSPRGAPNPLPTPPGDPFELDKPDAAPAPRTGRARSAAPAAAVAGPELSAPDDQPGVIQGTRSSRNDVADEPNDSEENGPLLALPRVNLAPLDDPGVPFGTRPPSPAGNAGVVASADADPAAPRRGFLSGLFSNLGWNRARR